MAQYTIELRKIIDIYSYDEVQSWFMDYDLNNYLTEKQMNELLASGVYDNNYKKRLADKIINHYFMREIGFETPYLFKHFLHVKLDEIMEEKAQLIYSKALQVSSNPLENYNSIETFEKLKEGTSQTTGSENLKDELSKENSGSSSSTSSASGTSLNINSDTPQGNINKAQILEGTYATTTSANETSNSVTDSTTNSNEETASQESTRTNASTGSSNETENYERIKKGNIGSSNSKLIEEFRKNLISIEKQIIEELNPLFMGLIL